MSDVSLKTPKLYKNPNRKDLDPNVGHNTPQYQKMGLTPEKVGGNALVGNVMVLQNKKPEVDNPRTRVPTIRQQPYAESIPDKFANTIPNVGNSMDHTWSGIDGEIINDLEIDPNTKMIDNNSIVDLEGNYNEILNPAFQLNDSMGNTDTLNVQGLDFILGVEEGQFILLVDDSVVAVGGKDQIVALASSLVFGEHDVCEGNPVPVDSISILKKMPIKIGLFLE